MCGVLYNVWAFDRDDRLVRSLWMLSREVHSFGVDGFTIEDFPDCTLHTLDMGVAGRFVGTAMHHALRSNIYRLTGLGKMQRGVLKMRGDISAYYRREHKANPKKKLTKMKAKFTMQSLVSKKTKNKPFLKAKGGETRCLVKFATELMQKDNVGPKGRLLAEAGRHLMENYRIMEDNPRRMGMFARRALLASAVNHVALYKQAGGHLVPKHHSWIHMALEAGVNGNPKVTSTYEDESENGVTSRIAVAVHPMTFALSSFQRLSLHHRHFEHM
jgi:hypothetical protein